MQDDDLNKSEIMFKCTLFKNGIAFLIWESYGMIWNSKSEVDRRQINSGLNALDWSNFTPFTIPRQPHQ